MTPVRPGQRRRREDLRLLLLQIREHAGVRREEHLSFARYAGLDPEQITVWNVFDRPVVPPHVASGFDALLVGGASEASVLEPETYPFVPAGCTLMINAIAQRTPTFASCFGFQLAVLALGGRISRATGDFEMGTPPIRLHPAAADDLLFRDTPDGFHAVSVHRESASCAPPGTTALAYTDACCHAFRHPRAPFWATQFHPEVDRPTLVERLRVYAGRYTRNTAHYDQVIADIVDTPESNALIAKFVERVLLG
ncbi:MAG: glutamine amidotransferase-related protein [Opitutales bacterium]